ncbi:MAG TPA: GNAT family N-acetyltransferase [Candidatus Limnocylindrales bacterium]|nr:GNAT family N-acetyltransferase [Candidatus Limnocylindrales bacterium]
MIRLETSRLVLREIGRGDFAGIHRYASDARVTRYLRWGPNTEAETMAFIERTLTEQKLRPRPNYHVVIASREDGRILGGCGLMRRLSPQARACEVGYCLAVEEWGRGVASEAVAAIVRFGFQDLGMRRIFALVDPDNVASARVLARNGFELETDPGRRKRWVVHEPCTQALAFVLKRPGAS